MKIGQPYYKLNTKDGFSTFENHVFIIAILTGISKSDTGIAIWQYHEVFSKVNELGEINFNKENILSMHLDVDYDSFLQMSESQQNEIIKKFGYNVDMQELKSEHDNLALIEIQKKKEEIIRLQDQIDEIENTIPVNLNTIFRKSNHFQPSPIACYRDLGNYGVLYFTGNIGENTKVWNDSEGTLPATDSDFTIYQYNNDIITFAIRAGEIISYTIINKC